MSFCGLFFYYFFDAFFCTNIKNFFLSFFSLNNRDLTHVVTLASRLPTIVTKITALLASSRGITILGLSFKYIKFTVSNDLCVGKGGKTRGRESAFTTLTNKKKVKKVKKQK